jgi:gamma-glutamyltranspeptidase/glutathione hydrolase
MSDALAATRRSILAGLCAAVLLTAASPALRAAQGAATQNQAAIASAHPLATAAGLEVLRKGGNAFDAAIAVSAALAVVEPSGSGIAGGGMYLLHRASDGKNIVIDAREVAPAAATRDMFLDAQGNPVRGKSTNTALAAGISGEPAGLALLQQKYGKLPLADSLQPAIRLARDGFEMYPRLQAGLRFKKEQIAKEPEAARVFLPNKGEPPAVGARCRRWRATACRLSTPASSRR